MTDRIAETFGALKAEGRKALVGYLTAGDPDLRQSELNIRTALKNGVDILELGVPFSDPTADGPAIQAAAQRALAAGTNVEEVLGLVRRIRKDFQTPVILFGYANPFFSYGYKKLCADAAAAGADGFLVVDMPFEESEELSIHASTHGLALIRLIAPTTSAARARLILRDAGGFVYYIMVAGVTGERKELTPGVRRHLSMLKRITSLPVVAGFGISNGQHAGEAAKGADGVVVGSALVKAAHAGKLVPLLRELHKALL